jgi:hypothetical protein
MLLLVKAGSEAIDGFRRMQRNARRPMEEIPAKCAPMHLCKTTTSC